MPSTLARTSLFRYAVIMAMQFDVSIDLTDWLVPPGADPLAATNRVRSAVERLPGAGWVSVEWCGNTPADLPWLRLFRPGCAEVVVGGEWDALEQLVTAAVNDAVVASQP